MHSSPSIGTSRACLYTGDAHPRIRSSRGSRAVALMNAEIIAVGSELLTPYRQDTNSLFLTSRLNLLGIHVPRKMIIGDDSRLIADAFHDSATRVPLVIASGGL